MIKSDDIGWSEYALKDVTYEGPFFMGTIKYELAENPTENLKRLYTLVATEGGHYDAINMYDSCIISTGLMQFCEARYYLTSRLLHIVAKQMGPDVIRGPLMRALLCSSAVFKKNPKGQWRFYTKEGDFLVPVNTLARQQALFLGCDGKKDSWSVKNTLRAKAWAAGMANIWQNAEARKIHEDHCSKRLIAFVRPWSKKMLFGKDDPDNTGYPGMLRAAFITFAVNNPARANKHLKLAVARLKSPKWSPQWCIGVLKELTWGPQIKIYPHRYEAIHSSLIRFWPSANIPETAVELLKWEEAEQCDRDMQDAGFVNEKVGKTDVYTRPGETVNKENDIEIPVDHVPDSKPVSAEKKEEEKSIVLRDPGSLPTLPRGTTTPEGVLGWILYILHIIMNFFASKKTPKDE